MSDRVQSWPFTALSHKMWEPLVGLVRLRSARTKSLEERLLRIEADREIRDDVERNAAPRHHREQRGQVAGLHDGVGTADDQGLHGATAARPAGESPPQRQMP